jgi:nitronate monooxygenase
MMLSFADPAPFAPRIKEAGIPLICQVQTLDHARRALEVGADILVAQGTEAGGHGQDARSTLPFVPAVADLLAQRAPDALLLAAGGIADGRGVAAALMLGADGVLMGTRFWATQEALVHPAAKARILEADGDETVRTRVYDIVRKKAWPPIYTGRLMRNGFIARWHGAEETLADQRAEEIGAVEAAGETGDFDVANVTVGEAIGLIRDIPKAGDLVHRIGAETLARLNRASAFVV